MNSAGGNAGFVDQNGQFTTVTDPMTTSKPSFNQLLGRNNNGLAVGFYNDAKGRSHPYEYDLATKAFVAVTPPGATSAVATGINDEDDVVGFLTGPNAAMKGFLLEDGVYTEFEVNGSTQTMALGVNDLLQIVGSYGGSGVTHGFVRNNAGAVATVDDPNGLGTDGERHQQRWFPGGLLHQQLGDGDQRVPRRGLALPFLLSQSGAPMADPTTPGGEIPRGRQTSPGPGRGSSVRQGVAARAGDPGSSLFTSLRLIVR
ncbi:MAG TPA: hypothetical protein VN816_05380 [Acidimicrobiales bacterium]|nr:hypothetical protein [Acidimicrobiales bacterium]